MTDLTKHSVSDNVVFKKIFYLKITVSTVLMLQILNTYIA